MPGVPEKKSMVMPIENDNSRISQAGISKGKRRININIDIRIYISAELYIVKNQNLKQYK